MCNTAAVTDDIKSLVGRLEMLVNINFHIIELDLNTVEKCVIIGCAGGNFVKSINHFDDTVKDSLWKHKTQIARCCVKGRNNKSFFDSARIASATSNQITETLNNYTAAQHIAKTGNAFAITVAVLERL